MIQWKDRLRASGIHLGISLFVASLAATLVFFVWYPHPYREISGGRELFQLVVVVDVILGPLMTFFIFNRAKPRSELRRDLAVVGMIQLAGLAYGLWTVFVARPVHLVFEYDRFRVVHAVEVPEELMPAKPRAVQAMPLTGPTLLAARPFISEDERMEATMAALQGLHPAVRPDFWQPYGDAASRVRAAAKPVAALKARFPARAGEIDAALARTGLPADKALWLPLAGRKTFWTVLIDPATAIPIAFVNLDSF
ncbi:MAG: pilus assembly protein [Ramlibacter sp.]|jgi:hypothetical protein|nr:pilus assembly protein [Ramlibacter sp.]